MNMSTDPLGLPCTQQGGEKEEAQGRTRDTCPAGNASLSIWVHLSRCLAPLAALQLRDPLAQRKVPNTILLPTEV